MNYNAMTDEQIRVRLNELHQVLDLQAGDEEWDRAYKEYLILMDIQDERYRMENQESFDAFYNKHIKGKRFSEIDPNAWTYYSDWHKDMYGFRPRVL